MTANSENKDIEIINTQYLDEEIPLHMDEQVL